MSCAEFGDLVGRVLSAIVIVNEGEIRFITRDGDVFRMYHEQDCCESVEIESIVGDLADLIGTPILRADVRTSHDTEVKVIGHIPGDSETWTFYAMATIRGYVDIRWFGASNGYYSEHVDFEKVEA